MMSDILESIAKNFNWFDISVSIIFFYCIVQCFLKGFSLSLISFMKWVISTVVTIILVPKLQPTISEYIESEFINNVGLGLVIFIFTLFLTIVIGKALGKAVTWTGVGSIDKTFGMLFGVFKGYVVSKDIFYTIGFILSNWGISAEDAFSFKIINKGEILIEEFPSGDDFIDTKEKIEKFKSDKLREECGVFGVSIREDASSLVALGLHALQHRGQEDVALSHLMEKVYLKKTRFSRRLFYKFGNN